MGLGGMSTAFLPRSGYSLPSPWGSDGASSKRLFSSSMFPRSGLSESVLEAPDPVETAAKAPVTGFSTHIVLETEAGRGRQLENIC